MKGHSKGKYHYSIFTYLITLLQINYFGKHLSRNPLVVLWDLNTTDIDKYQSLSHKLMFTQMNAKKRNNIFGERAIAAMFKEYKQLDDVPMRGKPVAAPFNPDGLTPFDRKKTLENVNLIKEKRCGKIKVRTCANGSKQRKYLKPDERVYSPTRSTKSLMANLIIDAMEKIYVVIFDVPGDFPQTALAADKFLLMRI